MTADAQREAPPETEGAAARPPARRWARLTVGRVIGAIVASMIAYFLFESALEGVPGQRLLAGLFAIAVLFLPVRALGGLAAAFIAWMVLRGTLGAGGAAVVAFGLGALATWLLPTAVLSRILWSVPLFAILIFVTVQLMFHVPGSPFASEKNTTPEIRAQQERLYGIPRHGFGGGCEFYANYMKHVVSDGSLGPCIKVQGRSVTEVLLPALPVSLTLGLLAIVFATAIGLFLGVNAGLRSNTWVDYGSMGFAIVGVSLPSFVIGAILIVVLSIGSPFAVFPVAGWGTYAHLVLPALALALPYAAYIARLARSGTVEVMTQDFVRTARAKGLSEGTVVVKHALKGALVPVVSFLGPAAAGIVTGSFVIETLFGIPGMGRWLVNGAINRDYYVVLGTVILECGIVMTFNLLVDLLLPLLDPRLRGKS